MHLIRPVLAALVCCVVTPALFCQIFQAPGPTGGDVRSLAADPIHPGTVYLGTADGHVFGSTDAGEHWIRLGRAGDDTSAVVSGLIVDERDGASVFATTWTRGKNGESGAVYLSQDGGRSWRSAGLNGHALRALAQAPSDPNLIAAGGLDGVFLSRDHGANWKRITPEDYAELGNVDSLAFDPFDASVLYAGTFHLPWKTKDGGEHWIAIHDGMLDDSDVLSLAADAETPGRILASACSGIYSSDSGGGQWTKIAGIPYSSRRTYALRQDWHAPQNLYAGTNEGLWLSKDGGQSWNRATPADWTISAIAIVYGNAGARGGESSYRRIIVGAEQQGILLSDDGGAHLRRANDGFVHQRVVSIAAAESGSHPLAVLMEDAESPAQLSEDGGNTWRAMGRNAGRLGLAEIIATPDGWRATLLSGGLARFDRGANAWVRQGSLGSKIQELAFSRTAWYAATDDGLLVSKNNGATWSKIPFGPEDVPVRSVQANADGTAIRVASSRGMVYSDDAGQTWTWHDLGLQSGGVLRLIWRDDTLLAFSPSGVFSSRDRGRNWAKVEQGLPGSQPADAAFAGSRWLVSMRSGGVYQSSDAGNSWTRVRTGERGADGAGDDFPVLTASPDGGQLYLGSANDGIFVMDLR